MKSNTRIVTVTRLFVPLFLAVISLSFIGCGEKTQKKEMLRVGVMGGVEAFMDIAKGFKSKMEQLGYVEGKNIVYDVRVANMDPTLEQSVAQKYVEDEVDLIFAFPTEPAVAAKAATQGTEIPVVFSIAGIEGNNLVKSVREPGGNLSGVRYPGPDLVTKRFEILLEMAPNIKRLYVPHNPDYPNGPPALAALKKVAPTRDVTLADVAVHSVEELRADLKRRAESGDIGMDAIQILPEALTQSPSGWGALSEFAKEHRIPLVGSMLFSADIGGIFSYCVDFFEVGEKAAPIADKVLKGVSPGSIPLVSPEAHFRINYRLAHEPGLKLSDGLLSRADEIIR